MTRKMNLKKIGKLMKRFPLLFTVLLLLLSSSCMEKMGPEEIKYVTLTVKASLDTTSTSSPTKTYMDIEGTYGKVKWSMSDKITLYNVFERTPIVSSTPTVIENDGNSAKFNFTLTEDQLESVKEYKNYLFYGSQEVTYDPKGKHVISLDALQTYAGEKGFSEFENASFGYCPAGSVTDQNDITCVMHNIFGILKVDVNLTDNTKCIKSVRITDRGGKYLAGQYSLSGIENGTPTLSHKAGTGGESFTIEKQVKQSDLHSGTFYFLVPPGTLCTNAGFDIAVYTTDGFYGGKTIKNLEGKTSIERSYITPINISNFKEKIIPVPESGLTANSYIMSATAGAYSIPADYMGNGYQGNGGTVAAKSNKIPDTATKAKIIWQARLNGDALLATEIISNAVLYKRSDGARFIGFHRSGISGNALVAVTDDSDNILWSWHLWIAADSSAIQTPVWLTRQGDATKQVVQVMDRNMGALSASPSALSQFHGLAYQFGRKDPFMGSRYTLTNQETAKNYASFASIYPATAIYCVEDDLTFGISKSVGNPYERSLFSSGKWCTDDVTWGDPNGDKAKSTPKNLYDPCPAGWRIIEERNIIGALGYDESGIINRPQGEVIRSGDGYAFKLNNNGVPIYFPAGGFSSTTTEVKAVGTVVALWGSNYFTVESQAQHSTAYYLHVTLSSEGSGTSSYTSEFKNCDQYYTMPVRCQKWTEPEPPLSN